MGPTANNQNEVSEFFRLILFIIFVNTYSHLPLSFYPLNLIVGHMLKNGLVTRNGEVASC